MNNRIAVYRKKTGLTQAGLATRLGWMQSRVGNYETGFRDPHLSDARSIVDALNATGKVVVTLDDVFPPDGPAR
jgi:putative transcriptional regulator